MGGEVTGYFFNDCTPNFDLSNSDGRALASRHYTAT